MVGFGGGQGKLLLDWQPQPGLKNSPCPRTVEHVGKLLNMGIPTGLEFEVIEGAAGKGDATEFCAFLQVYSQLPDIQDALANPLGVSIPGGRPDIAMALVTSAADAVKVVQMDNFTKLLSRFEKPIEVLGMLLLKRRDTKFQETRAFVNWARDNQEYLF